MELKLKEHILNYDPKFIIGKSFDSLTAHQVCHLLDTNGSEDELRHIQYTLNLDQVNWAKLIQNSKAFH